MEEEKKVSDESIVEEAKGETPEETTTEEGTETQETKETKTKKKKKSAAALEIELKKSEEKAAEMTDKYQRLMAEFENARKRNAKEQSHMYDVGAKEVLAKLLPVVDNFERGLDALSEEDGIVIFEDHSWLTDRAYYNATKGEYIKLDSFIEEEDIDEINERVFEELRISQSILTSDYFSK